MRQTPKAAPRGNLLHVGRGVSDGRLRFEGFTVARRLHRQEPA
jgi:hypothetical protein